jgi:hypothetical protein
MHCSAHPPSPPLPAQFVGTATFTLNHPRTPLPITVPLTVDLLFSSDRQTFTIGPVPVFSKVISTTVGENTTRLSVVLSPRGYFYPHNKSYDTGPGPIAKGSMELQGHLFLDHSIDLGDIIDVDSDSWFHFYTMVRSHHDAADNWVYDTFPMDANGNVTLWIGNGNRFENGILRGVDWSLNVIGKITPAPFLRPFQSTRACVERLP